MHACHCLLQLGGRQDAGDGVDGVAASDSDGDDEGGKEDDSDEDESGEENDGMESYDEADSDENDEEGKEDGSDEDESGEENDGIESLDESASDEGEVCVISLSAGVVCPCLLVSDLPTLRWPEREREKRESEIAKQVCECGVERVYECRV